MAPVMSNLLVEGMDSSTYQQTVPQIQQVIFTLQMPKTNESRNLIVIGTTLQSGVVHRSGRMVARTVAVVTANLIFLPQLLLTQITTFTLPIT